MNITKGIEVEHPAKRGTKVRGATALLNGREEPEHCSKISKRLHGGPKRRRRTSEGCPLVQLLSTQPLRLSEGSFFSDFQHHCVSSGFVGTRKKKLPGGSGVPPTSGLPRGGAANPPPFAPLQPSVSPGGTSRCCRSTSSRPHRRSFISPPSTSCGPSSSDPNLPPRGPLPCVPPVRGWI